MIWFAAAAVSLVLYTWFSRRPLPPDAESVLYQIDVQSWWHRLNQASVVSLLLVAVALPLLTIFGELAVTLADGFGIAATFVMMALLWREFDQRSVAYFTSGGVYYLGKSVPWMRVKDVRHHSMSLELRDGNGKLLTRIGSPGQVITPGMVQRVEQLRGEYG